MKKLLSIILSFIMIFGIVSFSVAFAETPQISKLAAFGDSIIYGSCQGKATGQNDSYGDQKTTNLLAKEYGLTKDATTTDKWFTNKSVPGNTTKQILENIKAYDADLLAQCDIVYMDGGINDACYTLSGLLSECGWGSEADNWTFEETESFIEKYSGSLESVSENIKSYFVDIITYISSIEGFDGKIIIQNNVNPFTGSDGTNKIYLWDEFINRTVTKGQKTAIEATKDIYSNVVQLDITSKLRNGVEYTGVTYSDSLHLTFAGNRAVYKELSLLINPEGTNLLTFESTEIPQSASWRTLYDFENYDIGSTSIAGVLSGDVSVVDLNDVSDSDGNLLPGYIFGSTKALKSSAPSIKLDFSSVSSKIYGYRFNMISSDGTTGNAPNTFIPYVTSRNIEVRGYIKTVSDSWTMEEYSIDSTITANGQVTSLNISDIQSTTYARIAGGNGSREYYIDDIQVLTADTDLPQAPTQSTSPTVSEVTTSTSSTSSEITSSTSVSATTITSSTASSGETGILNQTTGTVYDSLSTAISTASAGDTLKLLSDLSVDGTTAGITVSKSLIIDLGTKTLTSTNKRLLNVAANSNAVLTIKNGNIISTSSSTEMMISVRATNDLVLDSVTVSKSETGKTSGQNYGFVTILSPSSSDITNVTVKNCAVSATGYVFSDNNSSNAAWNLYVYNSDIETSANSIILKKDTAKNYDAIIYSGHIKNALLNTAHYPNLTIADGSYMTTTENGSKNTAVTAFAQEYWVYAEPTENDGLLTDAVKTDAKVSIRLNSEVSGMRFYTVYDSSKITGTVEEKGTLIGPKDKIGTYLTMDDLTDGNAVAVKYMSNKLWANNEFVGSLVTIRDKNLAREFVARAYVKVDGVYYYSATTACTSIADVADAFIADENSDYNTVADYQYKETVDKWAKANDTVA